MISPDSQLMAATAKVLRAVARERIRQEEAVEQGHGKGWRSPASADCSDETRLAILIEEVGEVGNALNERRVGKPYDLRSELVQVAAVAVAWVESLSGEGPEASGIHAPADANAACPSCGRDNPRFTGRYGPLPDGRYVCFRCLSAPLEADGSEPVQEGGKS